MAGWKFPGRQCCVPWIAPATTQYQTLWPQLMAASVIAIVPIAVIYIFFQRYFVAGVAASAVKG